jgi:hypothetical protein
MNPLLRDSNGDGLDDILVIYIVALDVDERPDNYRHVAIICSQNIYQIKEECGGRFHTAYNIIYLPVDRGFMNSFVKKCTRNNLHSKKRVKLVRM